MGLPLILASLIFGQVSCVKEDFDVTPNLVDTSNWVPTASIAQIKKFRDLSGAIGQVKKIATQTFWDSLLTATRDSAIIISGYVTSNDSAGNFYEVVTIQDHTGGIDIKINAKRLFATYRLKPGQRVLVKLNNLYLDYYRGIYQVGASIVDLGALKIAGIDMKFLPNYMQRSGSKRPVNPIMLSVAELNFSHVQKLVTIRDVQFWDVTKTYSVQTVNTNRSLIDCSGKMLILRTSGFAYFANENVPAGNGTITGVLGRYDNTLQLVIRDLSDVKLNGPRCGEAQPTPNTTIAELKAMCTSSLMKINSNVIIEGVVSANDKTGNLYKQLFIQDQSAGIEIKVDATNLFEDFPVGTKVIIACKDMYLGTYAGVVQLGGDFNGSIGRISANQFYPKVTKVSVNNPVVPVTLTIGELNDSHLGKLVQIPNVQFWNATKTWAEASATTNRMLMDCSNNAVIVRTSNYASFAGRQLPQGNGTLTGVLSRFNSDYQVYVRSLSDAPLNNPRCGAATLQPNTTIHQLKALCTSSLVQITTDVVVEAIVSANDKSGNLYKQLFIQDESGGIEFKIDITNLHGDFPVGTKVIVNCKDMYVGTYGGVVQLGGVYNNAIGRLPASMFYPRVRILDTGNAVSVVNTTIQGLNNAMVGRLVRISGVQFIAGEIGLPWAQGAVTNRNLEDFWENRLIVRTSNFANFAGNPLPNKSGEIVAILGKYLNDYQLYVRDLTDVNLSEPRISKVFLVNEPFASAVVNQPVAINGWQTIATEGTKTWVAKEASGNRYAEMSAHQSGETSNVAWLISPQVNLSSIMPRYLTFKTQFAQWREGTTLEIFVSSNYDGQNPANASWTKLNDAYIVQQADGFGVWKGSGAVNLASFTGNVHFAFKYVGSGAGNLFTFFRVDDFQVFGAQQ